MKYWLFSKTWSQSKTLKALGIGWPVSLISGCTLMKAVAPNVKVLKKLASWEVI